MSIEFGTAKQTRIARQTAKGTLAAAGAATAKIMRRETSTFELVKESYTTESEMTSKRQLTSSRHGVKTVNGKLAGILSPGTYADPLSAVLLRDFAAVTAIAGASITIAGTGPYTVTRAAGSFLTDGIKIGMVVRLTAGTFAAGNLNNNLFVTGVAALVLTVTVLNASTLTAEGPIAAATVTVPGKVTYVPETGHTNLYYTVEEWYPTAAVSERNKDVKFTAANISLPGSGNAKIDFTAIGLDQTADTTVLFTAPTAESTTESLAAANGVLLVNGASVAVVTDLSVNIDGKGAAADGVVGTNVRPDVFMGKITVSGSFTAYFEGGTIPDLFRNETSTSIVSALAAGSAAAADFMTIAMTSVKLNSSSPDDSETGLKRQYSFTATYNSAGGAAIANHATTIMICDSQAA
ncbi:MAG: phage tail tube protein [Telluria sp.]